METLKKVQIEPSKMEIVNNMVTEEIVKALENDYFEAIEGVAATGQEFGVVPGKGVQLLFLYNQYTPKKIPSKYIENEDIEMFVHTESMDIWQLENEKTRKEIFGGYTWEQEVKYGTLLYDRNGNVEKLRESLLKEGTADIDFWIGMCEFEPPVQYKKRAKI